MLRNRNAIISDKRAQCGSVGTPAGWVCHSPKGSGVCAGVAGFLGAPAPAWGLVPVHQVQRAQPKYVGPRHGAATHFGHVSGAPEPAKLWHGHAEVTSANVFSENSSHLVVKIE